MGTILSLAAFRGAGAKENGPCPSFPPSPAFTFSNIMKSVTCEKFKIQPSFPPLSPPRPLAFSDARLLLYFSPRLFACAREKREEREGGKCGEHIFALVDDGNDTEFSNSSPAHICTHTGAHRDRLSKFCITVYEQRSSVVECVYVWCGV